MDLSVFPPLNASLNATAAILLCLGYWMIRTKRVRLHAICMIAALLVSALFLGFYLYYHFHFGSKKFMAEGFIRVVYFSILLSHTVLAVINLPMVIKTFYHAFRKEWVKHQRIARWTFPIWLYVSVTGVLVYLMLYVWF